MNIHELDSYDLGDAVKFNDKLNPRIWGADEKMRPEVREQLLKIADDFREFLGIDVEVKDITVSGSNAAYTYTPHSDIDLHLVVDLPQADESEVYRELFDAKKYAYTDMHNIRIGGYDVELYVQDARKPHHSQGIYSVMNDDWVSVPRRRRPDVDDISVKSKFEDLGHRIEAAIKSADYEKISELSTKLKDYRQAGLDAHGEFGPENLAFKILRTQGLIKKLYDARNEAKDRLLSLDERKKKKKKKVRYGYGGYWYPGTAYAGQDHPAGTEGGDGGGDGGGESVREDATLTWDGVNPTTCMFLNEEDPVPDEDILKDFIDFCVKELKIKHMPRVKLRRDPQWPAVHKTFGRYNDENKTLEVAWGQRHIMDVLRTVAHELTHKHQHEREGESMGPDAGETGSPYENEANARAGVLMRDYGRLHPEYFTVGQAHDLEEGWKQNVAAGVLGATMALGAVNPARAEFANMTPVQVQQSIKRAELAEKYAEALIQRAKEDGRPIDTRMMNAIKAKASDMAAAQIQKQSGGQQQTHPQSNFPKQGSEQMVSPNFGKFEESASGYIPTKAQAKDPRFSMALTVDIKPGQMGKEANKLKLKTDRQGHPQIARANGLFENLYREYKQYKADEDYSPDNPPGPEFKPTMPAGTLRVDVSDVYDWYKLGQHISNMKGLGQHDFGKGPPSTIIGFGDEDTEHKFIKDLEATGLDVTDIDPASAKKPPGKKIKTDPTYNVDETIQAPVGKQDKAADDYYRFIVGKIRLGRVLNRQEQEFFKTYNLKKKLAEFAPTPDRGDDGEGSDYLTQLANRWWNAADPRDQKRIADVIKTFGYEITQVESEDDAVQLSDIRGKSDPIFISADEFDPDLNEADEKRRRFLGALARGVGLGAVGVIGAKYGLKNKEHDPDVMFAQRIPDDRDREKFMRLLKQREGYKAQQMVGDTTATTALVINSMAIKKYKKQMAEKYNLQDDLHESLLNEYRDRMYQYIKNVVPGFPDYVVRDWLYANFARGATQGPGWSFETIGKDIPKILADMGLSVNTKWKLVPNMKFTMDMWEPTTLKRLQARAGGSSTSTDPDVHIPKKDAERHATQAQLAQQQGGVRKEPVILIKTAKGYELLEGWHRTIQHFARYPDGYVGPAYVAVASNPTLAEDEDLDEVKMSPGALEKFATSPEARGIRAGFEAELIFRDTQGEADEMDPEPDYDADERCYSIQQVIDFFDNDDYGYGLSDRQRNRLEENLDEKYMEWRDEQIISDFRNDAEDLIRDILLEETPMDQRIHFYLTDSLQMSDEEADAVIKAGAEAPRFTNSDAQKDYADENPEYKTYLEAADEAEQELEESVEFSVNRQDEYWDEALDKYRDDYSGDDDSFFSDVGLRWMSDIANEYNLDWPVWNMDARGNSGSRDWETIGNSLQDAVDMPVVVSSNYHTTKRRPGQWIIEPDGSLDPDDKSEEAGLEIVSPPMPLLTAIEKLRAVTDWANDPNGGNAYTNSSTGLHMGVSLPSMKSEDAQDDIGIDYVKLILFMGDKYVQQQFGREANTYCASALEKLKQNIKGKKSDPAGVVKLLQHGLTELAYRELQKGVGTSKYTSAHIQPGYIEFRSPGGDWLAKADEEIGVLENTMLRFARAMAIAGDPAAERQEYAKKLYKLVTADNPEYADQLKLFSEFSAGTINKEQLKKQWADTVLQKELPSVGKEEYEVYRRDNKDSPDATVGTLYARDYDDAYDQFLRQYGRDINDLDVRIKQPWFDVFDEKNKIVKTIRARDIDTATERAQYEFGERWTDAWNIYRRPDDTPEPKASPRAQVAKRIATKPKTPTQYNYDIIDQRTLDLKAIDQFYAANDQEASRVFDQWLKMKNLPNDTANYGYRRTAQAVSDDQASDWEAVYVPTGHVFDTLAHADAEQARTWAQSMGDAVRPEDILVRRVGHQQAADARRDSADLQRNLGVQNVEPNIAQNFDPSAYERNSERIDAIRAQAQQPRQNWELVSDEDPDRVIHRMSNATADEVRAWIAQQEAGGMPAGFLRTRIVAEAIDPVSGAGAVAPRPIVKKTDTTKKVQPVEPAIRPQAYRSSIGQAIDQKDIELMTQQIQLARRLGDDVNENFADKKVSGKSRPGRVKRAGASCKGSVTDLRARAKKYGGEKGKMYHWCANMKSGKKK